MQQNNINKRFYIVFKILLLPVLVAIQNYAYAQEVVVHDSLKRDSIKHHADSVKFQKKANDISKQYDFGNLVTAVLHPKKKPDSVFKKPSGITVIPNIASNPSIGFQLGIKAVAGRKLGGDPNTLLSVAATSISYTTKGILYFYINHNVYTPGNKWNFQGNIVAAKSVTPDFGLGIGQPDPGGSAADQALVNAGRKGRAYHSIYLNLREKVYKEVEKNLFVGAGVSFDIRTKIQDKADTTNHLTPYNIYSDEHGFKRDSYRADGLLFNVQYTTRDNQNRAYKGIYADAGFRVNQTWMGSTKSAVQFTTDFRKYFSLSSENPEHVIAFWNWGSYLISGDIPYLELPGTAKDGSFRSGRGYTTGYFKGTRFNYSEVEYRFPILKNKFISGVAFFSEQTANDEAGTKLFQKFQPGGGGGLRVLFNKATRTNLCLDYAFGKFGSKGFFLGLNEAF
ncbi:BamA/TamA family outer membrane protein [Mucilaginibacter ginsenosidivorax]|uniref:BamA/TamA family outer membrane protein n=1 Tax=Mucilaginibacter ginsenosidivorax TaxID=862126 RepID=UPI001CEFADFB|nr:BamA/TamA family outer membrane protein [Mucilaginibacter ginsenosidivorax]